MWFRENSERKILKNWNYDDEIGKKRSEAGMGGLSAFTQEMIANIISAFHCDFNMEIHGLYIGIGSKRLEWPCLLILCAEKSTVHVYLIPVLLQFIRYLFVLIKKYISIFTKRLLMSLMIVLNVITKKTTICDGLPAFYCWKFIRKSFQSLFSVISTPWISNPGTRNKRIGIEIPKRLL